MTNIVFRFQDAFALLAFVEENKKHLEKFSELFSDLTHKAGIVTSACCDGIREGRMKFLEDSYRQLIAIIKGTPELIKVLKALVNSDYLIFEFNGNLIEKL